MILGFKKQFKPKILNGTKIHTIRRDEKNRWKAGNKIHFATGVRTKNYNQFAEGICIATKNIEINYAIVSVGGVNPKKIITVTIDGKTEWGHHEMVKKVAKNDGFDSIKDFFEWFDKDFKGKIIYWNLD